jgi:hypothetical protein
VDALRKDLLQIRDSEKQEHELALVELREVEDQTLCFGLFAPFIGTPIRSVVNRAITRGATCSESAAASIALIILRSYGSAEVNAIGPHGKLLRCELPPFHHVLTTEFPGPGRQGGSCLI